MKTRNIIFIAGGVCLAVILLSGFGFVVASGTWADSESSFHSRFHGRGFRHGLHNKYFAEFVLWRLDKKAEELNLSDAQKEKYKEIRAGIEIRIKEGADDRNAMIEEFHSELNKDNPDIAALAESVKKKIKDISDFMEGNLDLFVDFYNTLNDDQKNRLLDEIRSKMDNCRS